jgi:hypothetical protein
MLAAYADCCMTAHCSRTMEHELCAVVVVVACHHCLRSRLACCCFCLQQRPSACCQLLAASHIRHDWLMSAYSRWDAAVIHPTLAAGCLCLAAAYTCKHACVSCSRRHLNPHLLLLSCRSLHLQPCFIIIMLHIQSVAPTPSATVLVLHSSRHLSSSSSNGRCSAASSSSRARRRCQRAALLHLQGCVIW